MGLFNMFSRKKKPKESIQEREARRQDVTGEKRRIRQLIKVDPKSPMGKRNQRYKEAMDY